MPHSSFWFGLKFKLYKLATFAVIVTSVVLYKELQLSDICAALTLGQPGRRAMACDGVAPMALRGGWSCTSQCARVGYVACNVVLRQQCHCQ